MTGGNFELFKFDWKFEVAIDFKTWGVNFYAKTRTNSEAKMYNVTTWAPIKPGFPFPPQNKKNRQILPEEFTRLKHAYVSLTLQKNCIDEQ